MVVTTWLDRITDDSNVWLGAIKAEEAREFEEAAASYLDDSCSNLKNESLVRAALSCSCAANCLEKAGSPEIGAKLHFEAGVIYEECADARMAVSIRESMWAFHRAYVCFVQANDAKEAESARQSFERLASRANPFVTGEGGFELPDLGHLVNSKSEGVSSFRPEGRLREALDRFFALRLKGSKKDEAPHVTVFETGVDIPDEEGIASQLG